MFQRRAGFGADHRGDADVSARTTAAPTRPRLRQPRRRPRPRRCRRSICRPTRSRSGWRPVIPIRPASCCGPGSHPIRLNGGGMPADDVAVTWEVSDSPEFATIVATGVETATAAHGHSVHAIVPLDQGDWYYRFRVGDYTSPVGSTRPAPDAERRRRVDELRRRELSELRGRSVRRAPRSCRAHTRLRRLAGRLHLRGCGRARRRSRGARAPRARADHARRVSQPIRPLQDRSAPAGRAPRLPVVRDLGRSRGREQLRRPHTAGPLPMLPTFADRRFAAYQAWWEHQPVRLDPPVAVDQEYRIYRDMRWGELIDLTLLDGRQYRSDQACGDVDAEPRSAVCRGGRPDADDVGRRAGGVVVRHAGCIDGDVERDRQPGRVGRRDASTAPC